jgi:hypothetical protein
MSVQSELNAAKTHCPRGHEYTEENTTMSGPNQDWRRCRACEREKFKVRYQNGARYKRRLGRFDAMADLKNGPCADCGGRFPSVCMDFDHRDPSTKVDNISTLASKGSWSSVLAEVAKCDLVCANCHRIRSAIQFGWRSKDLAQDGGG